MTPEQKLFRLAIKFGKAQEVAHRTKDMKDRIRFVHAENALGQAALALYQEHKKELSREARRRRKD